jgi:TetR/AcrR family transcriptional regulator, transcriptional repressor for nem operon
MSRPSLRENLLDAGVKTIWDLGYSAAGVRDIVGAAGARPGSFTNHFASKEAFTGEVLERYFAYLGGLVASALAPDGRTARQRLRAYLDLITSRLEAENWARGCMIGNLSLETVVHSEPLRLKLVSIFERWREPFAECIAEGQASGEIPGDFTPLDLADFLLSSWQGAMLRMKVERSPEPLERFKRIIFATTFREVQT